MKRNVHETQTETQQIELLETEQPINNVLNFSSTLAELRKNVDPNLVRQRAGRRDRHGNVHMVEYVGWHTAADMLDEHGAIWGHGAEGMRVMRDVMALALAATSDDVTR